jgi:hypothetical protein
VYNVEKGYINLGIIGPTHARIKSHVSSAPKTMQDLVSNVENSPFATDELKNDVRDAATRHEKALADATQALSDAENATGSQYEDAVLRALKAEWEIDIAEQDARIAYANVRLREAAEDARIAAQAESDAIAARESALADVQAAMDAAKTAAAKADFLVQLCGKAPMVVQIPGFWQSFSTIHGSTGDR